MARHRYRTRWGRLVWLAIAGTLLRGQDPPEKLSRLLQIQVLEGEGAVYGARTRAGRPVSVQVTDETGRPVEGVAVSFRLPEEEPSGLFGNGLKTELVISGKDGKASVWGIQWGATPGPLRLRVTASKDAARAGIFVSQYLMEAKDWAAGGERATARPGSGGAPRIGRGKLITATLLAAGAVAGGLVLSRGGTTSPVNGGGVSAAASTTQVPQVGPPLIRITRP